MNEERCKKLIRSIMNQIRQDDKYALEFGGRPSYERVGYKLNSNLDYMKLVCDLFASDLIFDIRAEYKDVTYDYCINGMDFSELILKYGVKESTLKHKILCFSTQLVFNDLNKTDNNRLYDFIRTGIYKNRESVNGTLITELRLGCNTEWSLLNRSYINDDGTKCKLRTIEDLQYVTYEQLVNDYKISSASIYKLENELIKYNIRLKDRVFPIVEDDIDLLDISLPISDLTPDKSEIIGKIMKTASPTNLTFGELTKTTASELSNTFNLSKTKIASIANNMRLLGLNLKEI